MKIPKTFIPDKNLEQNIKSVLKMPEKRYRYNPETVEELLFLSEEFLRKKKYRDDVWYEVGVKLTKDLNYSLKDIEELSKKINLQTKKNPRFGLYISVLINKIITEKDEITLTLNEPLSCIGMYLEKGQIIVEGNTGNQTGRAMKGGNIIVKGNVGYYTGWDMEGGKLIVKGKIKDISPYFKKGIIKQGDKIVKQA